LPDLAADQRVHWQPKPLADCVVRGDARGEREPLVFDAETVVPSAENGQGLGMPQQVAADSGILTPL